MDTRIDHDDLTSLLEMIRRFVRDVLRPAEAEAAALGRVPPRIVDQMRSLGLFGLTIPPTYGGLGLSMSAEVECCMALGHASPAFHGLIGANHGIGAQGLVIAGTEAQKKRYLPRMAAGEIVGAFALSEPDAGSDALSIRTSARRHDNGWLLNGHKRYITNAPVAGVISVFARTGPMEAASEGLSCFLVDAGSTGLSIGREENKMGFDAAPIADVVLEDCWVSNDALLGGRVDKGFAWAMRLLDLGRIRIAALAVGVAERLIDQAVLYARERHQFGRPIGSFQMIQTYLADCKTEADAARALVRDVARMCDAKESVTPCAASAKLFASEMVGRVADRVVQIFGGAGYIEDYGIERLYRDVRLFRIYEGTSEIQRLIIARHMMKATD